MSSPPSKRPRDDPSHRRGPSDGNQRYPDDRSPRNYGGNQSNSYSRDSHDAQSNSRRSTGYDRTNGPRRDNRNNGGRDYRDLDRDSNNQQSRGNDRGGYSNYDQARGGQSGGSGVDTYFPNNNPQSRGGWERGGNRDEQYRDAHGSRDSRADQGLNYSDAPVASTSTVEPPPPVAVEPAGSLVELELVPDEPVDPEVILAERRRKRAEILAKYSKTPAVVTDAVDARADSPAVERENKRLKLEPVEDVGDSARNSPIPQGRAIDAFSLFKEESDSASAAPRDEPDEVSAADYNPDEDRKQDDARHRLRLDNADVKMESKPVEVDLTAAVEEAEEDEDDMFSIGVRKTKFDEPAVGADGKVFIPVIDRSLDSTSSALLDNFDDAEGYYKLILGELLDGGRYHVHANLGKGMFSTVVRARDTTWKEGVGKEGEGEVAIKVIRSQESMYKAGQKEVSILRKLMENDASNKKHLIRLLRTFEHRGHLCLVFENLSMNLREVVKRFGKDVGINLKAVRAYASQMFLGLSLLRKCDIMHADIKPDNILVNESKAVLKICDLGSACDTSENDITPYLVSRFYRAPEIILGLPYDCSLDTWSIGCTLYELYTGKILFPGRTNNHMLLLIMELKGKIPHKSIKKAKFGDRHFDESLNFLSVEKNDAIKTLALPSKAANDLNKRLMSPALLKKLKDDEVKSLASFVDLLEKMLSLDASKRPTPKELLNHPFIRYV